MARSSRRDDEDVLEQVGATDEPSDDALDEFTDLDDVEPDLSADEDDVDVDFDEDADDVDDVDVDVDVDDADDADGDVDRDTLPALLADEELAVVVAEAEDDDEDDDEDALREGEFICQSCFMAKRDSALADPEAMLCRDCT